MGFSHFRNISPSLLGVGKGGTKSQINLAFLSTKMTLWDPGGDSWRQVRTKRSYCFWTCLRCNVTWATLKCPGSPGQAYGGRWGQEFGIWHATLKSSVHVQTSVAAFGPMVRVAIGVCTILLGPFYNVQPYQMASPSGWAPD